MGDAPPTLESEENSEKEKKDDLPPSTLSLMETNDNFAAELDGLKELDGFKEVFFLETDWQPALGSLMEAYPVFVAELDRLKRIVVEAIEVDEVLIGQLTDFCNDLFYMDDTYRLLEEDLLRVGLLEEVTNMLAVEPEIVLTFLENISDRYLHEMERRLGFLGLSEMFTNIMKKSISLKDNLYLFGTSLGKDFFDKLADIVNDLGQMNDAYKLLNDADEQKNRDWMLSTVNNYRDHLKTVKVAEVRDFIDKAIEKYIDLVYSRVGRF